MFIKINYKLNLFVVGIYICYMIIALSSNNVCAMEKIKMNGENSASTYSIKVVNWNLSAGQKTYTSSFYVAAGGEIEIGVGTSPSSTKYYVGIKQPSGSERQILKQGSSDTTYAIPSSGYYKVYIHNVSSSSSTVTVQYMY